MKRIFSIAIILVMLCGLLVISASAAGNGSLSMRSASGKQGDTVTLCVDLNSNPGLVTMTIRVLYDTSVLQLTNVSDPGLLVGAQLNTNYGSPYTISWVDGVTATNNTKTGTIATFTFKILDNAKIGDSTVTLQFIDSYDTDYNENSFSAASGTVTVTCNHSYGSWANVNGTTHKHTCSVCSKEETANHNWNSVGIVTYPTLTAPGYTTFLCTDCGYGRVENYTFPDVPKSHWGYNSIEYAVAKGFFGGYQSGNFGPADQITREDFAVVMARLAKADLSKYAGRTGFPDVKAGSYYEKSVKWASETGVISGYNSGKFGVGDKITREQMVTILYRYAKQVGADTNVPASAKNKLASFQDAYKVSSYAKEAMIWALHKGVISGMTATTVGPQNNASRAQAATILANISKKNIIPI